MTDDDPTRLVCPLAHRNEPDRPRNLHDGTRICYGHARGLHDDITTLPALHDQLAQHLTATGNSGDGIRRTKGDEIGLRVNPAVVAARDHIRSTLISWARITLDDGPWQHPPPDNLTVIATWLAARIDFLTRQDWTPEIAANMRETVREARALIQPDNAYRLELGPCPQPVVCLSDTGEPGIEACPGTVIAVMRRAASRELLPSVVACTAHGDDDDDPHAWGPTQWHVLGRRMGRADHPSAAEAFLRHIAGGTA